MQKKISILFSFFHRDSIPKGVVLYFHGNHDNINRYAKYAENFTNMAMKYGSLITRVMEKQPGN